MIYIATVRHAPWSTEKEYETSKLVLVADNFTEATTKLVEGYGDDLFGFDIDEIGDDNFIYITDVAEAEIRNENTF